ncbi:hypothetical protein [Mangrovibacterium marinum]|uniref:ApbE family protein n=1 Tax=Mangrovibacterium marinum TaxID=1639118 RepID=A0A2T5C2K3_9BACT|nr:hypothetical protein [Mangrovibacterium marinum]PTN08938.1 hypothetical protein C8N47_10635 [Mangrovibacterium marinum]
MLFEPKSYRNCFSRERFQPFTVQYLDYNLWIGVDPQSYSPQMEAEALKVLSQKVDELKAYVAEEPFFKKSLKPYPVADNAPASIVEAARAAELAGTGPQAAKSGLISQLVGESLLASFAPDEMIVENDGDLYLKLRDSLIVSIFADDLEDSGLMGLEILPQQTPLGLGTGTGTKGQPINHSKATAVMMLAPKGAQASALAVGIGNRVKRANDLDKVLKHLKLMPEVIAAVFIVDDQIAVHGENELKLIL